MKIAIECEKCNSKIELTPKTVGHHAKMQDIEDKFRVSEIDLSHNFDEDDLPKEIRDLDIRVEELRIDCRNCGDYIVLNKFPSYVYRY